MSKTIFLSRTDSSTVGQWWWTVDRWMLGAIITLMVLGALLSFAGSPLVAERIGLDSFYFVKRHFLFLIPSFVVLIGVSLLSPKHIKRAALALFLGGLLLLIATFFFGVEIKGARRWLNFFGFSLQPSELVKPAFAVISGWLMSTEKNQPEIPGRLIASGLLLITLSLLLLQPDVGMSVVMIGIWMVQIFLTGIPFMWIGIFAASGMAALVLAYFFLPHVTKRIDSFLDPGAGDQFQISQSLEAFMNGGLFGQGPGEGIVKRTLPDAHADFIFSVAAEEFGAILCIVIILLFAFVIIRGLQRVLHESNMFVMLATVGLIIQFGFQALINIASSLHLIPTKGMTLPFLSYGGSSLLTLAIGMGMMLGLTRKRF